MGYKGPGAKKILKDTTQLAAEGCLLSVMIGVGYSYWTGTSIWDGVELISVFLFVGLAPLIVASFCDIALGREIGETSSPFIIISSIILTTTLFNMLFMPG